ncbi:MAG: LON peptidase substrate-binding domain-containing protein [Anaerolineae bacterium]|nr:LON peptidase substrate-binding domain-containing protein [Anaerolineae bacterium]
MFELPLFPLHTVLFPGIPVALHIFEPRYKQMIGVCIETSQPFGIVLIDEGAEALGPLPTPHPVGCTANILRVTRLKEGRMNIIAVGRERFRIQHVDRTAPYLIGQVETFPVVADDAILLAALSERLLPWVARYLEMLAEIGDTEFKSEYLPSHPLPLAFTAAHLLQIPTEKKQALLATENAVDMLHALHASYRREVALTHAMLTRTPPPDIGIFSAN